MSECVREMTFDEEYEILQKEKNELFALEDKRCETPFANCVVRRALRCIEKLRRETELKNNSITEVRQDYESECKRLYEKMAILREENLALTQSVKGLSVALDMSKRLNN